MDIKQAITASLTQSDFVVNAYLADLNEQDLLARPVAKANHLAWQWGHLIASEQYLIDKAAPGKIASLPAGFAEKHKKDSAALDDPKAFLTKAQYVEVGQQVRAETLRIMQGLAISDFNQPIEKGVPPFVKSVGGLFLFVGSHWLMHAGQWAIIRRKLGKAPLF